jgi:hypothetical protein
MKPTQPNRAELPVKPRPGLEVVYKRISHVPRGGIICTVTYLESKRPAIAPPRKQSLLIRVAGAVRRIRTALGARLVGLRTRIGV